MTTATTDLLPYEDLAKNMPLLLDKIDESLVSARAAVKALPAIVDEASKEKHFSLRKNLQYAADTYNGLRMPFTRKLNEIVKRFTGGENEFKSLIGQIDLRTDAWAREALAEQRKAQDKADAELNSQKAKIVLEGKVREELRRRVIAMLDQVREAAGKVVQEVTKETFEATKKRLNTAPVWKATMDKFLGEVPTWVTDENHFKSIVSSDFQQLRDDYLTKSKEILVSSATILETALTNKEEAQRLQDAEAQRQKDADAKATEEDQKAIDARKALATLDIEQPETAKVRVKMKLDILDNEAWPQLFSFWYVNDPKAKTGDHSKKTFKQLVTFAENMLNGPNGLMLEHSSISWVEDVKAK